MCLEKSWRCVNSRREAACRNGLWGPASFAQTADELSIVCEEARVPDGVRVEKDWVALKLEGPFPFSLTGVLSSFLQPLATAEIPIFALATFDTDYVLMKREKLEAAIKALGAAGHEMLAMPALRD